MRKIFRTTISLLFLSFFVSGVVNSAERPLVEGEDYEVMAPKGTKTPEVMEFFSYACGHCYTMETFINKFKKENAGIKVIPVPTDLGHSQWQVYIKAYYLGQLLKVHDQSHQKIFHQVNIDKKPITGEKGLKEFFLALGVDGAKYDRALTSVALDMRIRKAKQLVRKYRITGTPTFVANQRYKLNNPSLGTTEMIEKALKDLSAVSL